MENMNGRKIVEAGDACDRKNGCPNFLYYTFDLTFNLSMKCDIFYTK